MLQRETVNNIPSEHLERWFDLILGVSERLHDATFDKMIELVYIFIGAFSFCQNKHLN